MRELTFEEMDQAAGGAIDPVGIIIGAALTWATYKLLDYAWANKEAYYNYLIQCSAQYGGGPFDYRLGS